MTSKEIVLNEIKRLEHNLKIYEKENMTPQIEYAKTNIEVNKLILKDLEVLEILQRTKLDLWYFKSAMEYFEDNVFGKTFYEWYLMHYQNFSFEKLNQEEYDLIKEWLEGN